jgi:lipopolysaccharide transport protein LptA
MVALPPDTRRWLLPLLAMASLGASARDAIESDQELIVDSDGTQINLQANTLRMKNVSISNAQGTMTIKAQEATARGVELNLNNSEWEFRGAVHIHFEGGELSADTARVNFSGNRIGTAQVVGAPAQFSHQPPGVSQRVQGRANTINYDVAHESIRLSGSAWFFDGRNELNTKTLVYNLADRSVDSETGTDDASRVRTIIRTGKSRSAPAPSHDPVAAQ